MRCFAKNLCYVLLGSLPYFLGCAQKSSSPQITKSAEVSVVEKNLEDIVSPLTTQNKVPEEQPVFKKIMSDDSSSLSISGYNESQKEEVNFNYDLVNSCVSLFVKMDDGVCIDVSASVSYLDMVCSIVEINGYSFMMAGGERISFTKDKNVLSPARGNLNFTDENFAKAKYLAHEKVIFYLNLFEHDVAYASDEAHARYTAASKQFKEFLSK